MKITKVRVNRGCLKFVSKNLTFTRCDLCSVENKAMFDSLMSVPDLNMSTNPADNPQILVLEFEDCGKPACMNKVCQCECNGVHKPSTEDTEAAPAETQELVHGEETNASTSPVEEVKEENQEALAVLKEEPREELIKLIKRGKSSGKKKG